MAELVEFKINFEHRWSYNYIDSNSLRLCLKNEFLPIVFIIHSFLYYIYQNLPSILILIDENAAMFHPLMSVVRVV